MRTIIAITMTASLIAGCAGDRDDSAALSLQTIEEDRIAGTFGDDLAFSTARVEAGVFDVVVELNGMTLTAIIDRDSQVAEVDGFAANGGETQMLAADRAVLDRFTHALAAEIDLDSMDIASILHRVTSNWAQTSDTLPLTRTVAGSEDRAWVSLCSQYSYYVDATHDGNQCSHFDPNCTSRAQVGMRYSETYTDTGSGWTTAEPDHANYPWQTGECFGNCGGGCPGGDQTLTLDCHDHDQCVRNGHALASFWCDDEFTFASDDEFFAPRCPGT